MSSSSSSASVPQAPAPSERITDADGRVWFVWDEHQQNLILGSFFWGYLMTELPGGRLAEVVGARRVLGVSMLLASLLTLVTPAAANLSYLAIVALRAFIGFLLVSTFRYLHSASVTVFLPGDVVSIPRCTCASLSARWIGVLRLTGFLRNDMKMMSTVEILSISSMTA